MEAALFVYFASILGGVAKFFGIFGGVLLAWFAIASLNTALNNESSYRTKEPYPITKRGYKFLVGIGFFLVLLAKMLPDQKTMYIMGGAYLGQEAIQSETVGKVVAIINNKLDGYIEETDQAVKNLKKGN